MSKEVKEKLNWSTKGVWYVIKPLKNKGDT